MSWAFGEIRGLLWRVGALEPHQGSGVEGLGVEKACELGFGQLSRLPRCARERGPVLPAYLSSAGPSNKRLAR